MPIVSLFCNEKTIFVYLTTKFGGTLQYYPLGLFLRLLRTSTLLVCIFFFLIV